MKQLLLITFLISSTLLAGPKIEFVGGNTYDWGTVKPLESPLKGRAIIKNTGDEVLRIFRVDPACGCTTAPLSSDYIQPGDSAHLDIKLQLKNHTESIFKTIDVYTNDPTQKIVRYNLKADIHVAMEAKPKFFAFNQIKVGEQTEASLEIKNNTDNPITIKKIIKSHEDIILDLEVEDLIPAHSTKVVNAKYTPLKSGSYNAAITLMTNSIDMPRLSLTAYGNVD